MLINEPALIGNKLALKLELGNFSFLFEVLNAKHKGQPRLKK